MERVVRTVSIGLAVVGTVLGTIIGVLACASTSAGVADRAWLWPGDAPTLDLGFVFGLCGLVPALVGCALFRRELRADRLGSAARLPFGTATAGLGLVLCSLLISGAAIGYRHTPAWQQVRAAIMHYGDEVAADVGDRTRVLSREQFDTLRQKHVPRPIPVVLPGWGVVHIRMAHAVYPYVGVDFGEGRNAFFEPRSMLCTYSD